MSNTAGVEPDHFPMPVNRFLENADRYLKRGDILLSRSPTWSSRLIRFMSGGFFSHSALVFLVPQKSEGFEQTFVIESLYEGVGIGNLNRYVTGRKPMEEVGVLRLQGEGFNQAFFRQLRGLLLNHVHARYDYHRMFELALGVVFGMRLAWWRTQKRPMPFRSWTPNQFICSGFIQYGLVEAAQRHSLELARVMIKPGLLPGDRNGILGTTPEDIAVSPILTWRYVIRKGWVHRADSYDQAKKLMSGG